MTDQTPDETTIARRRLFRGGAVLAGVAGAAAVGAVTGPSTASAATGDPVALGGVNVTTGPTTISVGASADPVLVLKNSNGPALGLAPVTNTWNGSLEIGELVATKTGPVVGADFGNGPEPVFLTTARDLEGLPSTYSIQPIRVLDTRWKNRPESIVATSTGAMDSQRRLKAGAWMDIAIAAAGEGIWYTSVFANVAVVDPTKGGYLTVYPPGSRPATSTVNFQAKQNIANGLFMSVMQVAGSYAVRIYASATTHVLLDITGVVVSPDNSKTAVNAAQKAESRRLDRQAELVKHIVSSVSARSQ